MHWALFKTDLLLFEFGEDLMKILAKTTKKEILKITLYLPMLEFCSNNLPFSSHKLHILIEDILFFQWNYLKLFSLLNYSISFGYSNTIRIVFAERVITRYSVRSNLFFEYIFGIRFVQKFTIRWNSVPDTPNWIAMSHGPNVSAYCSGLTKLQETAKNVSAETKY